MDIAALRRDLDGIRVEGNPKIVLQKSRDFYWYSPVLKRQLDHVSAEDVRGAWTGAVELARTRAEGLTEAVRQRAA